MPSKSKAQRNFMAAAAHNPAFAKKAGIPTSVAKEFNQADKGKKFREGGIMKDDIKQDKAMAKKAVGMHEKQLHGGKKSNLAALKKGGKVMKYAEGGSVKDVPEDDKPPVDKKGKYIKPRPFKSGGCAKMARGGGIEVRGKTRGKIC
jgi:hypothetical protein